MINKQNDKKVDNIKKYMDNTIKNMETAQELITQTPDKKLKKRLAEKNDLRKQAIYEWQHAETPDKNAANEKKFND